jgi:hypothetical protein
VPVLGTSIFVALGLAAHDTAWTLAWVVLVYAAGMAMISVAESPAESDWIRQTAPSVGWHVHVLAGSGDPGAERRLRGAADRGGWARM